jgi:hypothetical protein
VKQLLFLAVIGMSPLLLRAHSSAAAPQDQNTKQDAKNTAKDVGKNKKMPANKQTGGEKDYRCHQQS